MFWKGSIWFLLTAGVASQEFSLHPEWWNETAKRGFKPRIPDFYQHQYYSTGQAGDTDQRADWEPSGGWCMPTALANCLYYWDTFTDGTDRPYDGLLGDDIDEQDDWLDAMCEEIKNLTSLFSGDSFQDVLNRRVAGKLTHTQHIVGDDGKVSYKSSEDSTKEENITAFDAIKRNLLAGNDVMLRLWAPPVSAGKYDSDLWWAGRLSGGKRTGGPRNSGSYHFVTVAGIDCDKKQIYFADPDSNKGSDDANAGWRANLPGVAGRKYDDDDDEPPVPERDENKPKSEPTDWEKYYSCVTMDEDGATFKDDPAVNKRYACIKIEKIEVIAPTAACPEDGGGGGRALMAALSSFSVRTPSTVFSVDRFIFYPTVPVDPATIGSWSLTGTPVGDVWSAAFLDPSTSDPLGNPRPKGGIEFKLDSGVAGLPPWWPGATAVVGTDAPFDKWDIVAHVMGGAPDEWLVQAHGFEEDPYEETSLDPEEEPTSSPASPPTRAPTPDVQPDDEEES